MLRFAKLATMSTRGWFWITALWAPILGIALYYEAHYRPATADLKINAQIAKLKIDRIRRCVEAADKQLPENAQGFSAKARAKCFEP
jgi:hypothetical protein